MKQQINLYQPMFRKQEKVFSAVTMLQITGFFIIVLTGIYSYNLYQLQPFSVELEKTGTQLTKLTNQIDVLSRSLPARGKNKLMESEITRMTIRLDNMKKIQGALSEGSFGNVNGFSEHFEALARGHVDGSWLTDITIANGGDKLALAGKSIDPELVPMYIKRLAQAPVFKNLRFNILDLERIPGARVLIGFNIRSDGP